MPDEQRNRLKAALIEPGMNHLAETCPGALHGFAVPDMPVFNPAATERHWEALLGLFRETIGTGG